MSKVRITFTEKFFIDDHTIIYHGVMIPLYGLLDYFIDIYYLQVVQPEVKLYYELKFKNGLSIDQKLRLIAETDRGRLIIREFSEFGTNASMAEIKRRFVPDWYIHPNGPVSSLTTGNHSYSEYYYLPLDDQEKWKRYVGTLPPSVPLFVSLFKDTTDVLARIISRSPLKSRSRSPSIDRDEGGAGGGGVGGTASTAAIDGGFVRDAGEITSPLVTSSLRLSTEPKLPTEADIATALAFDQTSLEKLSEISPTSETEEVISKNDFEGPSDLSEDSRPPDGDPKDPEPRAPSPPNPYGDSPPTYDDSKKDVLIRYDPNSKENLPAYDEIATGEIGTALTPPYNVKEFMKNVLSIQYVKTEHEIYELVKDRNFQKYFPKNFDFEDHSDIEAYKPHVIRAYIRLVSSIGYRYADFHNLKQLFNVQVKYFHDQDPQKIKDQIIAFNAESYDYSSIENELTSKQIERQKELVEEDIKREEDQISFELKEKGEAATATRILRETVSSAQTYAKKLLPFVGKEEPIKFMYCPQLNTPESMGELLNLIENGSIQEIKDLCKPYGIEIPSKITLRGDIGEYLREKLSEMKKPNTKHLISKFNIGGSGGWKAFTK